MIRTISIERVRALSVSDPSSSKAPPPSSYRGGLRLLNDNGYKHSSAFKSPEMEISIMSPSVRSVEGEDGLRQSLPVFGDHDRVTGNVTLDPQNTAAESGRLTITIEGVFEYVSPMSATKAGPSQITPGKHKRVFYKDSAVIPLYTASEGASRSAGFRSAFSATIRRVRSSDQLPKLRKSTSVDHLPKRTRSPPSPPPSRKTFNFDFALPQPTTIGDELPPTFSTSNVISGGVRGRVYAESADVKYCIRAVWEALDGSNNHAKLEAPILFQPDTDFQSLDGLSMAPEAWSETALSTVDELPVECAVTVPEPASFPRSSAITYFVVFKTKPRSRALAAEFMADATVAVSLVRCVSFDKPRPSHLPALQTQFKDSAVTMERSKTPLGRSASGSSVNSPSTPFTSVPPSATDKKESVTGANAGVASTKDVPPRSRLLKRVVRSAPPVLTGFRFSRADPDMESRSSFFWNSSSKPLPPLPPPGPSSPNLNDSNGDTLMPLKSNSAPAAVPHDMYRLSDSRTLHTDVSVGFPKRPMSKPRGPNNHPSLESIKALPDGLYKGTIPLQKGWFPTLKWKDLGIEYYLQVSVIFDNHEFKAKVPLRVY